MKKVITWQKKTAQEIIDGQDGHTVSGDYVTGNIIWTYRTNYLPSGILDKQGPCTCSKDLADCITIETISGPIAQLNI